MLPVLNRFGSLVKPLDGQLEAFYQGLSLQKFASVIIDALNRAVDRGTFPRDAAWLGIVSNSCSKILNLIDSGAGSVAIVASDDDPQESRMKIDGRTLKVLEGEFWHIALTILNQIALLILKSNGPLNSDDSYMVAFFIQIILEYAAAIAHKQARRGAVLRELNTNEDDPKLLRSLVSMKDVGWDRILSVYDLFKRSSTHSTTTDNLQSSIPGADLLFQRVALLSRWTTSQSTDDTVLQYAWRIETLVVKLVDYVANALSRMGEYFGFGKQFSSVLSVVLTCAHYIISRCTQMTNLVGNVASKTNKDARSFSNYVVPVYTLMTCNAVDMANLVACLFYLVSLQNEVGYLKEVGTGSSSNEIPKKPVILDSSDLPPSVTSFPCGIFLKSQRMGNVQDDLDILDTQFRTNYRYILNITKRSPEAFQKSNKFPSSSSSSASSSSNSSNSSSDGKMLPLISPQSLATQICRTLFETYWWSQNLKTNDPLLANALCDLCRMDKCVPPLLNAAWFNNRFSNDDEVVADIKVRYISDEAMVALIRFQLDEIRNADWQVSNRLKLSKNYIFRSFYIYDVNGVSHPLHIEKKRSPYDSPLTSSPSSSNNSVSDGIIPLLPPPEDLPSSSPPSVSDQAGSYFTNLNNGNTVKNLAIRTGVVLTGAALLAALHGILKMRHDVNQSLETLNAGLSNLKQAPGALL